MKKILFKVMKNKIINLIKILGFGLTEIVIDIKLSVGDFHSIEWEKSSNKVYLHIFKSGDLDIMFDFDELEEEDQLKIYQNLAIFYN